MALVSSEKDYQLIKLNPLFDWNRKTVYDFATSHNIPLNPLHAKGFASIGCAPCTRAIAPGEPERAGRWWWEDETNKVRFATASPASEGSETHFREEGTRRCKVVYQHLLRSGN
jgi:3'-phosphoadenosine 5'-phosphosulfate sulfotransferase (PAPS reductase)/FAD synthetase